LGRSGILKWTAAIRAKHWSFAFKADATVASPGMSWSTALDTIGLAEEALDHAPIAHHEIIVAPLNEGRTAENQPFGRDDGAQIVLATFA
jgi:hypothetical protein